MFGLQGALGGKIRRCRGSNKVKIPGAVPRNPRWGVVPGPSNVAGQLQDRIDCQGFAFVVVSDLEANRAVGTQIVAARYHMATLPYLLVDQGPPEFQRLPGLHQYKVALLADAQVLERRKA